jgi:hypothetical protein
MTCLLRQRLGHYGAMQIVRETPGLGEPATWSKPPVAGSISVSR